MAICHAGQQWCGVTCSQSSLDGAGTSTELGAFRYLARSKANDGMVCGLQLGLESWHSLWRWEGKVEWVEQKSWASRCLWRMKGMKENSLWRKGKTIWVLIPRYPCPWTQRHERRVCCLSVFLVVRFRSSHRELFLWAGSRLRLH